jgi:hypothetical protein
MKTGWPKLMKTRAKPAKIREDTRTTSIMTDSRQVPRIGLLQRHSLSGAHCFFMPRATALAKAKSSTISSARVESLIHVIRGQKVILDRDLAVLYEVPTKRLNEAVKRNPGRFPSSFLFQLTAKKQQT